MTLHRNPQGGLVRRGRTEQRYTWTPAFAADTATGALPSKIATPVGTATVRTAANGIATPHVQVAETAVGGAARQWLTQPIIPQFYEEIEFTLSGLRFSHADGFNFNIEIYETSQDRGIQLRHLNPAGSENYASLRVYSGAGNYTDHSTYYQLLKPNGGSQKARNVSLVWRPNAGEAFILEDDQVMAAMSFPGEGNVSANVKCMFTLGPGTDGVIKSAYWDRWDVALRHN